jgi:hypothetical protein
MLGQKEEGLRQARALENNIASRLRQNSLRHLSLQAVAGFHGAGSVGQEVSPFHLDTHRITTGDQRPGGVVIAIPQPSVGM